MDAPASSTPPLALSRKRKIALWLLPALILAAGFTTFGFVGWAGVKRQRAENDLNLSRLAANAEAGLRQRLATYADELQAGAAFIRASKEVTRAEWQEYAATIDLLTRYPGIRGVGVIYPVAAQEAEQFMQRARADGYPDFRIQPVPGTTSGEQLGVITLIEPLAPNTTAVGLDVFSERHRREAAELSRDTGEPRMTRRITLVQVGSNLPGSLLYVPVYRAGTKPLTVAERRAALIGWVYAPLLMEELVTRAIGSRAGRLYLQFFAGTETNPESLLYSSPGPVPGGRFDRITPVELAGQIFTMAWARGPEFVPTPPTILTWIAGSGSIATVLLAALTLSLQLTGWRARQLAEKLTRDMAVAQRDLMAVTRLQRAVLDGTVHAIIGTAADGRITLFNAGAEKMLGYSRDEVVGLLTPLEFHLPAEIDAYREELSSRLGHALPGDWTVFTVRAQQGETDEREWRYVRKDGRELPVLVTINALHDDAGEVTGFLHIAQDLTDRRKAEEAVREGEERLARVLTHAECCVWESRVTVTGDTWNWKTVAFASALKRRLQGALPKPVGSSLWDPYEVPEQAEMDRRCREAMLSGAPGYAQEFRLCREGDVVWLRESVAITRVGSGEYWLIGVAIDITERKRAEAALRESERRLSDVFRSMAEGVIMTRADGVIIECNDAAGRISGRTRDQLLSRTVSDQHWEFVDEQLKPVPVSELPDQVTLRTGVPQRNRVLGQRNVDGSVAWSSMNTEPVRADDGSIRGVVLSFVDITRRKRAEATMQQSQQLLQTVTSILPGMIGYWTTDLRCAFSNSEYEEWFGKTAEEMKNIRIQDLLGPQLFELNRPYIEHVLAGKAQQFERTLRKQNGDVRYTWAQYIPDFEADQATVRGFVVLVSDLTELKHKEEALRASKRQLRASLREVNDLKTALDAHAIVAITDGRGLITYANDRFCAISGYTRDELIGKSHRLVNSGVHPPEFFRDLWTTISSGRIWHGEICNESKTGDLYWLDATIVPFLDEHNRPVQYIAVRTDITERKKLEHNLAIARDQALEASRLKSEFLATMSHEIRTPMNAVIGMACLLGETPMGPEQADMVRTITTAAESLLTIINDILDFSRIEAGQLRLDVEDFDLAIVIEETIALLAPRAHEKRVELNFEIDPAPDSLLQGDPGRVRQVLMNLVGNAVKFTERGEITVTAAVLGEKDGRVRVRLAVRDTGVGIPPEARDRLFRPFVQVDGSATRRFGGTGLGLAITRQLVVTMGGQIGFESEAGRGSLFWVELEFRRRGAIAPETCATLAERRVLVVDHNPTSRGILERQLGHFGIRVETAIDGPSALTRLQARTLPPCDAVVVDHDLPGMTGLDLALAARSELTGPPLPIAMLVSKALRTEAVALEAMGNVVLLAKPAPGLKVARALEQLFAADDERRAQTPATMPSPARPLNLLLVEDNLANQRVASLLLASLGHTVELATNGNTAIERLAGERFDAVLMDCQMPLLDGYETTRRIRSGQLAGVNAAIPVVALTAYARDEDRQRCFDAGMDDYVSKPIRLAELKAALSRVVSADHATPLPEPVSFAGVLDLEVLETTRRLPGANGGSLLPELVALYAAEEAPRLDRITVLLAERAARTPDELHALGGNAAAFGGVEVRRIALELEELVRQGHWADAFKRLGELRAASQRLRAAMDNRGEDSA